MKIWKLKRAVWAAIVWVLIFPVLAVGFTVAGIARAVRREPKHVFDKIAALMSKAWSKPSFWNFTEGSDRATGATWKK